MIIFIHHSHLTKEGNNMKKLHFLQLLGFTIEIFSGIAIIINMIANNENHPSRLPLYLLFLVGVLLVCIGNIINRNKK